MIDPVTPTTLYVGTTTGVYKSTNGDGNWIVLNTGLDNTYVYDLVIDAATPTTLYATTKTGLYKSSNGGATWHPRNTGLLGNSQADSYAQVLALDSATPHTLYVGTQGGGIFARQDVEYRMNLPFTRRDK